MEQLVKEFGLDFSLFIAFLAFLGFTQVMDWLVFSRFLLLQEARFAVTGRLQKEAQQITQAAQQLRLEVQDKLHQAQERTRNWYHHQLEQEKKDHAEKLRSEQNKAKEKVSATLAQIA